MTDKLKQIIKKQVGSLSLHEQEAINSVNWPSICEEIGKKNLLDDSETNDLVVKTLLVLLRLENIDAFSKNIENEIGLSKEEADKISGEVEEGVFKPIYEKLFEKIKVNMKGKTPGWEQSLGFILSGGDYSVFLEGRTLAEETEETKKPNMSGIKDKLVI